MCKKSYKKFSIYNYSTLQVTNWKKGKHTEIILIFSHKSKDWSVPPEYIRVSSQTDEAREVTDNLKHMWDNSLMLASNSLESITEKYYSELPYPSKGRVKSR